MAGWITADELRNRLPLSGEGVTDSEIEQAIEAAVEYVEAMGGEGAVGSALCRAAVSDYAHASCLDIIFPRDARDRDSGAVTLRENAAAALFRYREIREAKDSGTEPDGVPDITVGYMNW